MFWRMVLDRHEVKDCFENNENTLKLINSLYSDILLIELIQNYKKEKRKKSNYVVTSLAM